jgi:cephalosporin hydroxylase
MVTYESLNPELDRIRAYSKSIDCFSWTSDDYQRDILKFILENSPNAQYRSIIEVGCFRGGLTVQLAAVCRALGLHLHTMDVWDVAVDTTRKHLNALKLADAATVFHGDLSQFVTKSKVPAPILLTILDGDHLYQAVRKDIESVYRLSSLPYACVFHDYSLRHPTIDERVSDAVADAFGEGADVSMIGAKMTADGSLPTKDRPQPDGHYWQTPGSEGAIVLLPKQLM